MKLLYAHCVGLIGIYSKSQVTEISIDFTRCNHKVVMIIGKNGYGKSTLMEVLQPLPDQASMYMDKMKGLKELTYAHQDEVYKISIQYPVYANGERAQTKAFIYKVNQDGSLDDLNPNGNIGSYKEVLYARFNLDPSFLSLSHLSIDNRGIVDMKPSDRKKYVASILESTDAYNSIYKALVKRSGVYRSMLNSITAKIDSIGDEEKLNLEMQSLVSRLAYLNQQKDLYSSKLSKAQATIEILDPDKSIQTLYTNLMNQYNTIKSNIDNIEITLKSNSISSEEEALSEYTKADELRGSISTEIQMIQSNIRNYILEKEEEAKLIQMKQQRISSLSMNADIAELKNMITESRKKIYKYESDFKRIGLSNFEISRDEYISGLNTLNDLRSMMLNIKSYSSNSSIMRAIDYTENGRDELVRISSNLQNEKGKLEAELEDSRERLSYYNGLLSRLTVLRGRPDECNIDSCVFIKDALEAKAQDPEGNSIRLKESIDSIQYKLITINKEIEEAVEVTKVTNDLAIVIRTIKSNKALLDKLPNGSMFGNIAEFLDRIRRGDNFNDIAELYNYVGYGNYLELYKVECKTLIELENTYKMNKEKSEIIDSLYDELSDMMNKLSGIESTISTANVSILELEKKLVDAEDKKRAYGIVVDRFKQLSALKSSIEDVKTKISSVEANVSKLAKATDEINIISGNLMNISSEIAPEQQRLDQIKYSLAKLLEYREELAVYNDKFNLAEIIKKYSSPTKEGIQLLFMKLYMGPSIELSNRLLSLLFDGQLELEFNPDNINKDEFKIPCINKITSVKNDDISSCSTAERFMISMIMSIALLFQASTKYNIVRSDEADATLDAENRAQFPAVVKEIMDITGIEMWLMVSHSSESDLSDMDIISLSPINKEKLRGNVIFSLY